MSIFDPSSLNNERYVETEIKIREISGGCEPPALMLAADMISERELEMSIDFARYINSSIGRAMVMQGIVLQESLDLAIDLSLLVRSRKMRREKALEVLRFEREMRRLKISKDTVIRYVSWKSEVQLPKIANDTVTEEEVDPLDQIFSADPELCRPVFARQAAPVEDNLPAGNENAALSKSVCPSASMQLLNPLMSALQGVFARNPVFYSR